jgi:hypothetical protein
MAGDDEIDPEFHRWPDRANAGVAAGVDDQVALVIEGADPEFGVGDR